MVVQVPDIASAYQSRMKTADLSTGEEVATFNKLQEDIRAAGVEISCDFVSAVLELSSRRWTIPCPIPSVWSLPRRLRSTAVQRSSSPTTPSRSLPKALREANFKVQIAGTLDMGVLTVMDVTGAGRAHDRLRHRHRHHDSYGRSF